MKKLRPAPQPPSPATPWRVLALAIAGTLLLLLLVGGHARDRAPDGTEVATETRSSLVEFLQFLWSLPRVPPAPAPTPSRPREGDPDLPEVTPAAPSSGR